LSSLVEFHEELAPNTIYRVNQFPALRITGVPSPDSTIPDAGAKAVELAETELQRQQFKNYAIVNLSEK
jgi:multidrug efflux pump subunit AcrB